MEKEKVLGFNVCSCSEDVLLNSIINDYKNGVQNMIVNINPEIVINNYKDETYKKMLNEQQYQIPDGIGIVYASKINRGKIKNRITGIDFMHKLCAEAVKCNAKIFLYGTQEYIINQAKVELEKEFDGIQIVGVCNGFTDEKTVLQKIKEANPDILYIGTGSPRQEKFILNYKKELSNVKIFMPVGGSFDVISKTLKRAPNWVKKMNIEWLYRLLQEPKRFFRQLKLIKFIFVILINKIRGQV